MQLFNKVAVLEQIGSARLAKFLNEFSPDLAEINIAIPCPDSDNGSYFDSVSALLNNPFLPRRLGEAVGTLETAAESENQSRIDDAIARRLPCVAVSTTCALDRVLELWFQARDELVPEEEGRGSRVEGKAPENLLSPSVSCSGSSGGEGVCSGATSSAGTNQPLNDSTGSTSSIKNPASSSEKPTTEAPKHQDTDAAVFARLASLSPADYDRARKAEAKRLGIRVETLDAEVDRHRELSDDEKAREVILKAVVPWPEPVNGAEVLDQVASRFKLHVVMHPCAADAIALWQAHAHIFTAFRLSPRLNLTSPEPECGKTTTVDLIAAMTPRPLRTENLTAPVLFRVVAQQEPVLLLDEVDTFLPYDKELRGLVNAGHKRGGCAVRCEGTNNAVRVFKAFAPAVLAGIGPLSGTLHGRSIRIHLVKAKEGEVTAHFNELKAEIETELCRKVARWTQDNFAAIAACDPVMPKAAFNRLGDNWRPLFAIAQIAGGDWPARAIAAFTHLSNKPPVNSVNPINSVNSSASPVHQPSTIDNQLLLTALRPLFIQLDADRLFSRDLVSFLCADPNSPWLRANRGRPISEAWLAWHLGRLGICPRQIQIGKQRSRGYLLSDIDNALSETKPAPSDNSSSSSSWSSFSI